MKLVILASSHIEIVASINHFCDISDTFGIKRKYIQITPSSYIMLQLLMDNLLNQYS